MPPLSQIVVPAVLLALVILAALPSSKPAKSVAGKKKSK